MDKKVSIIVPVYNCEKYIAKCLQSVVNQSYKNTEIIVVDDGSTDRSAEICDRYAEEYNNIKVIHQKNRGVGETRNVGVSHATGDYITYVDADDYISSQCIEKAVTIAEKYQVELVEFGKIFMLSSRNIFVNCDHKIEYFDTKEKIESARSTMKDTVWGRLYRRELAMKVQFPDLSLSEDAIYSSDIFKHCQSMVKYNYCLYAYRAYQESLTRGKAALKKIKDKIRNYEEHNNSDNAEIKTQKTREFIAYCRKMTEDIMYRREQIISAKQLKEIQNALGKIKENDCSQNTVNCSYEVELDAAIGIVEKAISESKTSGINRLYKQLRNNYSRCIGRIKVIINYEYNLK